MDVDRFWELVEASRRHASDCEGQTGALISLLEQLHPEEIVSFRDHLNARRGEAYRWDLWAVAYIVNGGCSDDCFDYFGGWLVAQGRDYFEAALTSPERAADRASPAESIQCEGILYAPRQAYKNKTGRELPLPDVVVPQGEPGPRGSPWEEDELAGLYPELYRRFFADIE